MWWFHCEAKVAGELVAEAELGAMLVDGLRPVLAIDPTARVAPTAVVGSGVEIGPYCVIGPNVTIGDGCKLVEPRFHSGPHHDRRTHLDRAVRLARLAAAVGALSRRGHGADDRRGLRHPRACDDQPRHREGARHDHDRSPRLHDGRRACRARLRRRQSCGVRQQCDARRVLRDRRLRVPGRAVRGPAVHAHRRARDDRRRDRCHVGHHPLCDRHRRPRQSRQARRAQS